MTNNNSGNSAHLGVGWYLFLVNLFLLNSCCITIVQWWNQKKNNKKKKNMVFW